MTELRRHSAGPGSAEFRWQMPFVRRSLFLREEKSLQGRMYRDEHGGFPIHWFGPSSITINDL